MIPAQRCAPAVLVEVLRHQPLTPAKLTFAWRLAVGAAVARATTIDLRSAGRLFVESGDARWRDEIGRSRDLVLARLRHLLGPDVVRDIRFSAGGGERPGRPSGGTGRLNPREGKT